MTPAEFIAKWRAVTLNERAVAQSHFNDPCASRLERWDDDDANPRAALTRPALCDESDRTLNHYATHSAR